MRRDPATGRYVGQQFDYAAIARDRVRGMKPAAIRAKHGCGKTTIHQALKSKDIHRYPLQCSDRVHPALRRLVRMLNKERYTAQDVARQTGHPLSVVLKWLAGTSDPRLRAFQDMADLLGRKVVLRDE